MKTTNTFTVYFLVRPVKQAPSEAMLFVRVVVGQKRLEISLKKRFPVSCWDAGNGCIRGNKKLEKELNPYLADVRYQLMNCFRQLHLDKRKVTPQAIKTLFLGQEESSRTLLGLMSYHQQSMKGILAAGTLKNYFTTERYIKLFLEKKHRIKDMDLADLNFQFIAEFESFLRQTTPLDPANPLTNNGIMKHMERLRKMVTLAVKLEWLPKDPFQQYSLKFLKVDKPFLTGDELARVEAATLSPRKLNLARDLFVFSCYTGLSYVDLADLRPSHLYIGDDGEFWIKTARRKTEVSVHVPLLSKPKALLEKYRNDERARDKGLLFPRLSNQKVNAYLKQIGELCCVEKPFSFHTARHTFATTVTLANGVPLETVSKMLGHTKLSTTQIYARVLEKKIGEDMKALKQKLEH